MGQFTVPVKVTLPQDARGARGTVPLSCESWNDLTQRWDSSTCRAQVRIFLCLLACESNYKKKKKKIKFRRINWMECFSFACVTLRRRHSALNSADLSIYLLAIQ